MRKYVFILGFYMYFNKLLNREFTLIIRGNVSLTVNKSYIVKKNPKVSLFLSDLNITFYSGVWHLFERNP